VIEEALNEAKCVVVLWSELSVKSEYVRDEATFALGRYNLIPVTIENVKLPFRFKGVQTLSLLGWDGSKDFSEFRKLVDSIAAITGSPGIEARRKAQSQRPKAVYDVFISFKNLDEKGVPTPDAELANEVYNFLTSKGLSIFISTVTLESLGVSNYKKAIDEALDAASIMIAVGTSTENLNSEWVI